MEKNLDLIRMMVKEEIKGMLGRSKKACGKDISRLEKEKERANNLTTIVDIGVKLERKKSEYETTEFLEEKMCICIDNVMKKLEKNDKELDEKQKEINKLVEEARVLLVNKVKGLEKIKEANVDMEDIVLVKTKEGKEVEGVLVALGTTYVCVRTEPLVKEKIQYEDLQNISVIEAVKSQSRYYKEDFFNLMIDRAKKQRDEHFKKYPRINEVV